MKEKRTKSREEQRAKGKDESYEQPTRLWFICNVKLTT
jgi:hypothetical protein